MVLCCLLPQKYAQANNTCVALTFDDGPTAATEKLLDGLAERNIRATFFLCCYRIAQYPETVRRMAQEGHEISIHGCSHDYFTQMSQEQLIGEISCTRDAIFDLTGVSPSLLRPPGGLYNECVRRTAEELGLAIVLWSVDPEDWNPRRRGKAANHVVQRAKHGDIILMHDLNKNNVSVALETADRLAEKGFSFRTVSALAEGCGLSLVPGKIYRKFS